MKLRIDTAQLNELSDAQKQRLRELWEPKDYDVILYKTPHEHDGGVTSIKISYGFLDSEIIDMDSDVDGYYNINDCLPLLSIGQMIEILQKNNISNNLLSYCNAYIMRIECEDICDALWQAVKEIL